MQKADEIITSLLSNISKSDLEKVNKQVSVWKEVVSSIKSNFCDSSQLADHSHIIDLENHTLIVETDHPARAQIFQFHKKYILVGLNKKLPELKIQNLQIRVKAKTKIKYSEEDIKKAIEENLDKREREEISETQKTSETPQEIIDMIERIKAIK